MRQLSASAHPFERCTVSPSAAFDMFAGNVFKLRVIEASAARGERLTVYRCGPFVDLCRYRTLVPVFELTHSYYPFQRSPRLTQRCHWRHRPHLMLCSASQAARAFHSVAMSACQWHGCSQQIAAR
jgi:hypothetical protein